MTRRPIRIAYRVPLEGAIGETQPSPEGHPRPLEVDVYGVGDVLVWLNSQGIRRVVVDEVDAGLVTGFGVRVVYWCHALDVDGKPTGNPIPIWDEDLRDPAERGR